MANRKKKQQDYTIKEKLNIERNVLALTIGDSYVAMSVSRVNDKKGIYPYSVVKVNLPNPRDTIPTIEDLEIVIEEAYNRIKRECRKNFKYFYLTLPSWNLNQQNYQQEINLIHPYKPISQEHLHQLYYSLQNYLLKGNEIIVDIVPQYYILDNVKKTKKPINMMAEKLKIQAHIITTDKATILSLLNLLRKFNLKPDDIVSPFVASATSVLSEEEKEEGVVLIDIGNINTCCSFFFNNTLFNTHIIPFGGTKISYEVSRLLGVPFRRLEDLSESKKILFLDKSNRQKKTKLPVLSSKYSNYKSINLEALDSYINSSVENLLSIIIESLNISKGYIDFANAGIVFIGESYLTLRGIVEIAKNRINLPIKMGEPLKVDTNIEYRDPIYSRLFGTIQYCYGHSSELKDFLTEVNETPLQHIKRELKQLVKEKLMNFIKKHL